MSLPILSRGLAAGLLLLAPILSCARPAATPGTTLPDPDVPAALPLKWAPRPTVAAITPADLMTRLYIVADDSMEGREAATAGNLRALAYVVRELTRIGAEPAGDNGTFYQTIDLVNFGVDSSVVEVDGRRLTAGVDYQGFGFAGNVTAGAMIPFVRARSAPVIYGGVVGDTATYAPADRASGALVILAPRKDAEGRPTTSLGAFSSAIERYSSAAAIAFATLDMYPVATVAGFVGPSRTRSNPNRPTSGRPGWLFVSRDAAERLLGTPLETATAGQRGKSIDATLTFSEKPLDTPARNVVAVIRGSDPAVRGQYIAVGAHNDHVGMSNAPVDHDSLWAFNKVLRPQGAEERARPATDADRARIRQLIDSLRALRPPRPDSIFNGADDDGSGTVALLEVAEALAAQPVKPKRSIIFVWHTAEELGLFGARFFTDHPTVPRDSIVAQINMDMIGRGSAEDTPGGGPRYLQLLGSRRLSTEFGDIVDSLAKSPPHDFVLDYQYDAPGHPNQFYCRSDHYMYARYGIPIVFFSTGGHQDYHMLTDEPQYIDYRHLARVTRLVRDLAVVVADRERRITVDQPKPQPGAACRQ